MALALGKYNHTHEYRVAELSYRLANKIGLSEKDCKEIHIAGFLHDIGKIKILPSIISKKDKLTKEEIKHIRKHVYYGITEVLNRKYSPNIIQYILLHHENFDGSGYYVGLKENEIPVGARILRICDVFDALTSERSYKEAYTKEKALNIMIEENIYYDPQIFESFVNMLKN